MIAIMAMEKMKQRKLDRNYPIDFFALPLCSADDNGPNKSYFK